MRRHNEDLIRTLFLTFLASILGAHTALYLNSIRTPTTNLTSLTSDELYPLLLFLAQETISITLNTAALLVVQIIVPILWVILVVVVLFTPSFKHLGKFLRAWGFTPGPKEEAYDEEPATLKQNWGYFSNFLSNPLKQPESALIVLLLTVFIYFSYIEWLLANYVSLPLTDKITNVLLVFSALYALKVYVGLSIKKRKINL